MIKKIISILVAMILSVSALGALADSAITITLDGEPLASPVSPMIVNDSTMVPFRVIFEALDMQVNWSEALQKVYAMNDEKTIILTIGSEKMIVNTDIKDIPAAPFISNGHTLVPVRAISEAMNCKVDWDGEARKVILKTPGYVEPEPPVDEPEVEQPSYTPIIDDTPAYINKNNAELEDKLIELINTTRSDYGLDTLTTDDNINQIALAHSEDMADLDYLDHTSPSGYNYNDRLDMAGIYYISAAETLASGFLTAEDVVESWLKSPAHKEIILHPAFTHIGVGYYAGGNNGTYWTMMLVSR
ncbi:MAG: hypothetical protein IKA95_02025 [Clostridia bacterium]|nr:hypothetical protein [Clostridia bacterium]